MSSLGITLLILVFLCIGGVIAYNAWLARREGKELTSLLSDTEPVVDPNRSEPSFGQDQQTNPVQTAQPFFPEEARLAQDEPTIDDRQRDVMSGAPMTADESAQPQSVPEPESENFIEPVATTANAANSDTAVTAETGPPEEERADTAGQPGQDDADPQAPVARDVNESDESDKASNEQDSRFDCVVRLTDLPSVAGARLRQLAGDFVRVGAKPVIVAGVNATSSEVEPLVANHEYSSLVLALLLVNRSGPVNPMEYSEFANRTQAIADELDVLANVPDMNDVLTKARALDEELATLDAQVAVNVQTEQALNPGNLLTVSKRLSLTEQGNNRYVRTGDDRQPIFSVSLSDKANRLVLLLDVPRVPANKQPIREMVECAWHCCQAFEGKMIDDGGRPIDNDLFERIERQLETHYQALQAAGVAAGSEQARRVFN